MSLFAKAKIRIKIISIVIAICLFALLGISTASYITVKKVSEYSARTNKVLGDGAADSASGALLEQAHNFLTIIARQQAVNCNAMLDTFKFDVELLEGVVTDIFNNPQFTAQEVGAKDNFKSNFMSDYLKIIKFSREADAVLKAGKELWTYYHSKIKGNDKTLLNASFYDIREFFQGRSKTSGSMNTKSNDTQYNDLIKKLRQKLSVLAEKIKPKLYNDYDWLENIIEAEIVKITKGSYNGKKDCFELLFLTGNKPPYSIFLTDDQFVRETPLKKDCWYGKMDIYVGGLYQCKNWFDNCYYREADKLPCCKPVENMPEFTYAYSRE